MSNNGHYMINIYKDKFLEKSYSTTQENFGKIHTALMELAKEYHDLSFSFGFDGVDNILEMDRSVADKVFKCINKTSDQQPIEDENGVIAQVSDPVEQPTADEINHPTHYCNHPSGVECITITRHHDFNTGNAIKYLWRCGLKIEKGKTAKEMEIKDLKKAVWYINDRIKQLEGE